MAEAETGKTGLVGWLVRLSCWEEEEEGMLIYCRQKNDCMGEMGCKHEAGS